MKQYYYDLHIHSALSPCANDDMSPSNIVNMAKIKGLDIISVCDHNSADNLPALSKMADSVGITLIPGIEVSTKEDVHILCYFPNTQSCLQYSDYLYELLPDIPCIETIFGRQFIFDNNDSAITKKEKLLINSVPLGIDAIFDDMNSVNGVAVFAHIERRHDGVLSVLGFLPERSDITAVELTSLSSPDNLQKKLFHRPLLHLHSSDAHTLSEINERTFSLQLHEKSVSDFLSCLRQK